MNTIVGLLNKTQDGNGDDNKNSMMSQTTMIGIIAGVGGGIVLIGMLFRIFIV